MGPADLPHAWAWLPGLAQPFLAVAERRAALPAHAVLHFPRLMLTGAQLQQACAAALGAVVRQCSSGLPAALGRPAPA
jgi:hypothetical protein